jgi:hypothetical protein
LALYLFLSILLLDSSLTRLIMADAPRSLQQGSQLSSHPNAVAPPDVQFNLPLEIWDRITHALLRPRPTAGSGPGQDYSQADLARLMRVSSVSG